MYGFILVKEGIPEEKTRECSALVIKQDYEKVPDLQARPLPGEGIFQILFTLPLVDQD